MIHYFAYGSNMDPDRMNARVGTARVVGRGVLLDMRLSCNKRGRDGSGKANIVVAAGEEVWGVAYALPSANLARLDEFEQGYRRADVEIALDGGSPLTAQTYVAETLTDDPTPFDWYKELMLRGARVHGLPDAYLEQLAAIPVRRSQHRGASTRSEPR